MLTLPLPPRRAWLVSFWLIGGLFSGLLLSLLAALFLSRWLFGAAVVSAAASAAMGLLGPRKLAAKPYLLWNKAARLFAQGARRLLLGLCFYITFVAVGRFGAMLCLRPPTRPGSVWIPRDTARLAEAIHRYGAEKPTAGQWIRDYCFWAVRSGNGWSLCLLPFLYLLRILHGAEGEQEVPTNAYTLF